MRSARSGGRLRRRRAPVAPPGQPMLLRARLVLTLVQPPLEDGAVLVSGNRIVGVGRWRDFSSSSRRQVHDLGEVILLPGLVNAHCHLDYTHLAGRIPPPQRFTDWLQRITQAKAEWRLTDYRQSWRSGAAMLLRTGTTTVGDIEAVTDLLPGVWRTTPLRVLSFLEMTGIRARRAPAALLREAREKIATLPAGRCRASLSPHAPYSTLPALLRQTAVLAEKRRWPVAIHVAESEEEFEMIRHRRGGLFHWLQHLGRDMRDCGLGSPVQLLERAGLLRSNLLAVHANYLAPGDASRLARQGVSVAHCPRSHAYFRHQPFPLRRLLRNGVNVCLGTDSLATVRRRLRQSVELNLFAEMRELAAREPWLRPGRILEMATRNAARALGLAGQVGELAPAAFADLIAIPSNAPRAAAAEAVVWHPGQICAGMIDGQWTKAPAVD